MVTDAAVVGIEYTGKFAAATVRETAKLLKKSLKPAKKEKKVCGWVCVCVCACVCVCVCVIVFVFVFAKS